MIRIKERAGRKRDIKKREKETERGNNKERKEGN